jgi:cell division protein FtsB
MSTPLKPPTPGRGQFSGMQIVFGSILAITLLLAINFSGRIAAGRNIAAQRGELERNIRTLEARSTALRARYDFVNSDAFVEGWARDEGNMVRPNEYLVVPVPNQSTPMATPTPLPMLAVQPEAAVENWQLWWGLFFDSPPPR